MKTILPLAEAEAAAQDIVALLAPACERIEIAGSIRRKCEMVGDIEIVAIPKMLPDLFGEPTDISQLDVCLRESNLVLTKDGPRYKQFPFEVWLSGELITTIQIDLFLADADNWGYILMLRTGPWQFSQRMVTLRTKGGYRPPELQCKDGYVWTTDGYVLTLQTESLLFSAWGMEHIPPKARK